MFRKNITKFESLAKDGQLQGDIPDFGQTPEF
jgi:hypothetical protein